MDWGSGDRDRQKGSNMGRDRWTLAFDHHNMVPGPKGVAVVQVMFKSEDGILFCYGTEKPGSVADYATGCLFLHTDGTTDTALYVNEGDATTANFVVVTTT